MDLFKICVKFICQDQILFYRSLKFLEKLYCPHILNSLLNEYNPSDWNLFLESYFKFNPEIQNKLLEIWKKANLWNYSWLYVGLKIHPECSDLIIQRVVDSDLDGFFFDKLHLWDYFDLSEVQIGIEKVLNKQPLIFGIIIEPAGAIRQFEDRTDVAMSTTTLVYMSNQVFSFPGQRSNNYPVDEWRIQSYFNVKSVYLETQHWSKILKQNVKIGVQDNMFTLTIGDYVDKHLIIGFPNIPAQSPQRIFPDNLENLFHPKNY